MKFNFLIFSLLVIYVFGNAPNLGDKFKDVYKDGLWYIMFYAPWCGYCKQLEPIWDKLHDMLSSSQIHVAKIDATVYKNLANQFKIEGFPTIIMFAGGEPHIYKGQRNIEELIVFADRVKGPHIRSIANPSQFEDILNIHANGVFFMNVDDVSSNDTKANYKYAASKLYMSTYFYTISLQNLPQSYHSILEQPNRMKAVQTTLDYSPTLFVFKDDRIYPYIPTTLQNSYNTDVPSPDDLYSWVRCQQFRSFIPELDSNVIHESHWCDRTVVFAYVKKQSRTTFEQDSLQMINALGAIALRNVPKSDKKFWFGWTSDPDLVSSLTSTHLKVPSIIAFEPRTFKWYIFTGPGDNQSITKTSLPKSIGPHVQNHQLASKNENLEIPSFLNRIAEGREKAYGGNSLNDKIYRKLFGIYHGILEMFAAQPFLSTVIFGLPLSIFAFLIYHICWGSNDNSSDNEEDIDDDDGPQNSTSESNLSDTDAARIPRSHDQPSTSVKNDNQRSYMNDNTRYDTNKKILRIDRSTSASRRQKHQELLQKRSHHSKSPIRRPSSPLRIQPISQERDWTDVSDDESSDPNETSLYRRQRYSDHGAKSAPLSPTEQLPTSLKRVKYRRPILRR